MQEINLSEKEVDTLILSLLESHSTEVEVDAKTFLDLLKFSLSLNTMEKKRVVDAVPTLSQFQFDELSKYLQKKEINLENLQKNIQKI